MLRGHGGCRVGGAAEVSFVAGGAAEPVEQHIDHGRGQQREQLAGDQPADDGHAQGLAQLGPLPEADGQRQRAQGGGQRRHQDGAEAQHAGLAHRLRGRQAARALGFQCEVDDEDGVLLHDADQQEHADERDDGELHVEKQQREHRAHAGRGQRGEHGDGVDQALVEDAQHDVDHHDGRQDQEELLPLRLLEAARRALEAAAHVGGHGDVGLGLGNDLPRLAERGVAVQVEGNGGGQFAVLVADGGGRRALHHLRDGRERHHAFLGVGQHLPGGRSALAGVGRGTGGARRVGRHEDVLERRRAARVAGGPLHDDRILVQLAVDGGHGPLAEGVVEHRIDGRAHAQTRGAVAVHLHVGFRAVVGLVGVHVGEQRLLLQALGQLGRPDAHVGEVVAFKRVLVRGIAGAPAHAQVLRGREEDLQAGERGELRPQPADHGHAGIAALGHGLEVDEHEAAARAPSPGEPHHGVHGRVLADDVHGLAQLARQRPGRDALVRAQAGHELAVVLLREKALGDMAEQVHVEADHREQDHDDERLARQRPVQRMAVAAQHRILRGDGPAGEAAPGPERGIRVAASTVRAQQPRAHHRRGGERDHQRDRHRHRERDREFAEQPAHLPVHEEQRDEHRHERQADGQHGEADLARALQGRLHAVHAGLDVAAGVLQHHDGVVHHEAGGHREGHEAEVVQAEAQQVHDAEGAQQRDDGGHRGDDRGAGLAQEQAHHQHHQRDGDHQRDLDLAQRGADGVRAVRGHGDADVLRQLRLQRGDERAHAVHRLDDVGARLARDEHDDGRLAVEEAERAGVLHAVDHLRHVAQAHRSAVAPGDDEVRVVGGPPRRRRRVDLHAAAVTLDGALGPVGIGRLDGGAHVLRADAVAVQRERQQLHAHRGQRAASDLHVAHALHLRDALADHVGDGVVDLARGARPGGEREDDDRRIRRVDLAVGGVAAQGGGQVRPRGVDGGLHFARGAVDLAVQVELQADARRTARTGGRHLVHARDHAQAPLQRRRHAGGHGLGAGAGQAGRDGNGRIVHLRQRRHRQQEERRDARQRDADGEQHRGHGPLDEGAREVHGRPSPAGAAGGASAVGTSGAAAVPRPVQRRPSRSKAR